MVLSHYVLDTSVILTNPYIIYNYPKGNVVIPAAVLEELDRKKRLNNEIGTNAREFSRLYMKLRNNGKDSIHKTIMLDNGGTLKLELNHKSTSYLEDIFIEKNSVDNRILTVAANLAIEKIKSKEIVHLVTSDYMFVAKGDAIKDHLDLNNFFIDHYNEKRTISGIDKLYKGYQEVTVSKDVIEELYEKGKIEYDRLYENIVDKESLEILTGEFLICSNIVNKDQKYYGRIVKENGDKIFRKVIHYDPMKTKGVGPIKGNMHQFMLYDLLFDHKTEIVTVIGESGTGKTLMSLASSMVQVEMHNRYRKLLVARPTIPLGENPGALPGDINEKIDPWMKPIHDNLEFIYNNGLDVEFDNEKWKKSTEIIEELKYLEVEPLAYIRGRTLPNQILLVDEAQNLTPFEAKTIATRAGKGTKIIFAGDPSQIDHPYLDSINNGLVYVTEKMKDLSIFGTVTIEEPERSNLAKMASRRL